MALPASEVWFGQLPDAIRTLERKWSLSIGMQFVGASCAWVASATIAGGTSAVLKIGMPHMEGEDEIKGLRFWNGCPTVRLLAADDELNAMLLERCDPGTALKALAEREQDLVIADLLRWLWRQPPAPHAFRPLSDLMDYWSAGTLAAASLWRDPGLVREGLALFKELSRAESRDVLLATDLHAGNVLRAQREPWLVIDPKPFVGDPAYDATQHLLNCPERLRADHGGTVDRFADLLEVDRERVRLWMFARATAEPRDDWSVPLRIK